MATSWRSLTIPLAKLVGLIVVLPFAATYLHSSHYAHRKNEYCFVGPARTTHYYSSTSIASDNGNNADNQLRGDATTATTTAGIANGTDADDSFGYAQFYGIYAPTAQKNKKKNKKQKKQDEQRRFQQIYATVTTTTSIGTDASPSRFWAGGWPSVTQSSVLISSPSSRLSHGEDSRRGQDRDRNSDHVIAFAGEGSWCLRSASRPSSSSSDVVEWCSDPPGNLPDGTVHSYPPSGVWKPSTSSGAASSPAAYETIPSLTVTCPAPATTSQPSSEGAGKKHKRQNARQNQNLQFLLDHPATTLLLAVNVALAFHYWNHRIDPGAVCKQYRKIVEEHEWWRGLTGATAHFEPLHIGFNMMSLHTLGKELEGGFGSLVFLIYNVALVVLTTAVMMGMVHARLRWNQRQADLTSDPQLREACRERMQRLRETSSVGYSAVLFAWMVVSTMERKQPTCPIPFFSDVCFSTYSVPGMPFLKFNVSPIVSLFVAQFIMPRVSFMGHLAGIVCGFFLHWGWTMPPLEICSPNVLIGGVFLLGLIWRRRVIPVRPLLTAMMDKEGCAEHENYLTSVLADGGGGREGGGPDGTDPHNGDGLMADPFMRSKQKKKKRELQEYIGKQKTLRHVRSLIGIVTVASLFTFCWSSSLVLCQCILLTYFTYGIQSTLIVWAYARSKEPSDIIEPERVRSGMIWRGFFMTAVLAIVVDSMSMASWFVFSNLIASEQPSLPLGLLPACVLVILRTGANLLALVLSSKILHDMSQIGGGIFVQVFSPVIKWSKSIGDHGGFVFQKPLWTAFEGRGITLGTRGR